MAMAAMCEPSTRSSLLELLEGADAAALLTPQILSRLADHLTAGGVRLWPPLLGSETAAGILAHPRLECPSCGAKRKSEASAAADAVILDVAGAFRKRHTPIRCRSMRCAAQGQRQWHNYLTAGGQHKFTGPVAGLQCFMLTARFGVTVAWLQQLTWRITREHVTFAGEASVAQTIAREAAASALLPQRLRLYIAEVWFKWRLVSRLEAIGVKDDVDLHAGVEDLIERFWERLETAFVRDTAQRARVAGMRCDVLVVDGNAKNRRPMCAMALQHAVWDNGLNRSVRVGCPRTPLLGSKFCREHAEEEGEEFLAGDLEITAHEPAGPAQMGSRPQLRLKVRETVGDGRDMWVSEEVVHPKLVREYLRRTGAARLGGATDKRRRLATPSSAAAGSNDLPLLALDTDLGSVACRTHKEDAPQQRLLARTAGVLCACLSSGIIVMVREIYGCESLSQRYLFISALVENYPEAEVIVHDDACHLHKFAQARASSSERAQRIAPPSLRYACDSFHMAGHKDAWCRANCDPRSGHFASILAGIRTSVCEFTFAWLSGYKSQTKHMSEWSFRFFLQEVVQFHNESIFLACNGAD